ncbi:Retrovirus-related Pol polyprotein from type-2 retrotransposable element R2DM [Araneus ventricosus]|uniref:Retrovirus-related Pol polyprotein from type-2 retrotransposable element R2DM n=1 Tax=Araneus ventricosus TaxID=182803 RepID=A0A4Y2QKM7_ARAVE|nr:Retrovirus-related Pol polyprotein from type-2 retrotransposable element R2DM [Araneus ventricosus]GBN63954.1 Retrovirus-related Pol polyprotein from type-2 retrotransposable element R2DM [Araneus ventricosus]GBN63961.1 Retrovirus-related Pol polyprotein from type-2 retrotransposable element R2DM [Araneus ventricosus]GBN63978.1 Retrovirus-related Pol polyprotein from type-2 retrotransposable element R2DM [Araneus ventricosus]
MTSNPYIPGELRPISIGNVLVRLSRKILAKRLRANVGLDPRQKGFAPLDGMMENTTVMDCVLSKFYTERTELHLASVDLQKAFDSVAHKALLRSLECLHVPAIIIDYIAFIYTHCRTTLEFDDGRSLLIHPTVVVRQGDQLSPLLFNIALDEVLRSFQTQL